MGNGDAGLPSLDGGVSAQSLSPFPFGADIGRDH